MGNHHPTPFSQWVTIPLNTEPYEIFGVKWDEQLSLKLERTGAKESTIYGEN